MRSEKSGPLNQNQIFLSDSLLGLIVDSRQNLKFEFEKFPAKFSPPPSSVNTNLERVAYRSFGAWKAIFVNFNPEVSEKLPQGSTTQKR